MGLKLDRGFLSRYTCFVNFSFLHHQNEKVRAAKDHGKKFQGKLAALSEIIYSVYAISSSSLIVNFCV